MCFMKKKALALLPAALASYSLSPQEIVLPLREALEAIDILESKAILILGWEGCVKTREGQIGHGKAPQGTESLHELSVREAAAVCRQSILEDAARWESENPGSTDELHFCITVHA
jgi:hypothetical protein